MRLGLFSMPVHPPERAIADTYDDDFATFQVAEDLGYDEVWIGEHFTSAWENIPAPDLFISAATAKTKRIKFGTGVVLMPFHNPLHVALRLAQLDHQTRGRIMVGVGSGGIAADKAAFGIEVTPEQAGKLTWEGIDLVLKYWAGEPVTYDGEFFKANVGPAQEEIACGVLMRPYQQPHPPIAIAGVTKSSYGLTRAGERGWLPLSTNFLPGSTLPYHWEAYSAGATRAGRTPERSAWRIGREIHVAETSQLAREQALATMGATFERYMLPLVKFGGRGLGAFKKDESMPDEAVTVDYLMNEVFVVGSVEEVVEKLGRLDEIAGGFGTVLQIVHDFGDHPEWQHRSMELLATRVVPQLNRRG
jgi:alkanesulfonate monooxygenase SsuD/methylene tetrahydromethanopterin reductase-like flavin-dependent oxidoreductase (luciferase family)